MNGGNSNGFSVTFSNVQQYIGLIQCNSTFVSSFSFDQPFGNNATQIENFTVIDDNSNNGDIQVSSLSQYAGWVCGEKFGSFTVPLGASYVIEVSGCINIKCNATSDYCGGIVGAYYAENQPQFSITACQNSGNIIGNSAGGIAGAYYGNNADTYSTQLASCSNSGSIIGNYSGGIVGAYCNPSGLQNYITTCANTGIVTGENAYGIAGYNFTINVIITNTYTLYGSINEYLTQSYGYASEGEAFLYVANGRWSTNDVINNQYLYLYSLSSTTTITGWVYSPLGTNQPFLVAALYPNNINYVTTTVPSDVPKYKTRTELARPAMVGTQRLETVSTNNVFQGDLLLIKDGTTFDLTTVVRLGSIFIAEPLTHSYIAGTPVYIYPPNTTLSEILAEQNLPVPIADICFVKNTPIETDQGIIAIQKIDPSLHTINNKKIITITKSVTEDKFLVCFEKHALGENIPSTRTIVSKYHKIQNKEGNMMDAYKFLEYYENVKKNQIRWRVII